MLAGSEGTFTFDFQQCCGCSQLSRQTANVFSPLIALYGAVQSLPLWGPFDSPLGTILLNSQSRIVFWLGLLGFVPVGSLGLDLHYIFLSLP